MKYILKKEYPGSPKLDSVVEIKNNGGYELENSTSYFMTKDKVENYPEFWEKVVEKDYEILSYIHNGSKHIWKKDPKFETYFYINQGLNPCTRLEDILKYPKIYLIHSIKRKDGEIFTIGDNINHSYQDKYDKIITKKYIIEKIYFIETGRLAFYVGEGLNLGIGNMVKAKQPLFTTEQRSEIEEIIKNIIK